jgi:ABC-type sugar transport system substrate-binding protein
MKLKSLKNACLAGAMLLPIAMIAKADEQHTVGVMVYDATVPYFSPLIAGAEQAGKDLGVKIDIQDGKGDLAQQIAVVQQFIAQGTSAMVLAASDSKGIAPVVRLANEAKIPVIATTTVIDGADSVTYVGSDDTNYGRYLGKAACQLLNGKGKIAVIMGILGSSPQFNRKDGLDAELSENCPGVTVVQEITANWDNAQALAAGQDLLNRFGKDGLDAIVGQGPETVAPARWAEENGYGNVRFIVGDIPKAVADAVKAGFVDAAVWQDPYKQGYRSVEDAVKVLNGHEDQVKKPYDYTPNEVISKDNIETVKPY